MHTINKFTEEDLGILINSFELHNVSKEFSATENQNILFTFNKIEDDTLYYSMNIAGLEVSLSTKALSLPKLELYNESWYGIEHLATDVTFKLLFLDKPIKLSNILYLVEFKTDRNIAPYGFCSCGSYYQPVWDENPSLAQYCSCQKYVD